MPPFLEIACFNAESAIRADRAGANRVELCAEQSVGGLTPSLPVFLALHAQIKTPINVMIRPHCSSFVYTPAEFEQMGNDIEAFCHAGAAGFVLGCLTPEGTAEESFLRKLVGRAKGRPCTFHRAFDEVKEEDVEEQLERVIACGFKALLTSGGAPDAVQGKARLKRLVEKADGRIEIIVGGGVRSGNLDLLRDTGANWFHSSATTNGSDVVDGAPTASNEELQAARTKLDSWI